MGVAVAAAPLAASGVHIPLLYVVLPSPAAGVGVHIPLLNAVVDVGVDEPSPSPSPAGGADVLVESVGDEASVDEALSADEVELAASVEDPSVGGVTGGVEDELELESVPVPVVEASVDPSSEAEEPLSVGAGVEPPVGAEAVAVLESPSADEAVELLLLASVGAEEPLSVGEAPSVLPGALLPVVGVDEDEVESEPEPEDPPTG